MKAAYADPPYIGQAHRYPENEEVDHHDLLTRLAEYDAWALSCSSPTLGEILAMPECPDVRIGAWVKPFAIFKSNVNPGYCWEPVIFYGCRAHRDRSEMTVQDFTSVNITLQRGVVGAKPEAFCLWVFDMLGLGPDDDLDDLYPGTGGVTDAWRKHRTRMLV